MKHAVTLTRKSGNSKTGPIPVTPTSKATCSPTCPLFEQGCYAAQSHLGAYWRRLSATAAGDTFKHGNGTVQTLTWDELCAAVTEFDADQLWRHNQAGDLPGDGSAIDIVALAQLTEANKGKRGFTYTHKPPTPDNAAAIKAANDGGFTINLSGNNLAHADKLADRASGHAAAIGSAR